MKTPYLGKGVLWVLKEFGKVSLDDIVSTVGWTRKQVYDEIRRLNMTILKVWISETSNGKGEKIYELDPTLRNGASIECLHQMSKKTFEFGKDFTEKTKAA